MFSFGNQPPNVAQTEPEKSSGKSLGRVRAIESFSRFAASLPPAPQVASRGIAQRRFRSSW